MNQRYKVDDQTGDIVFSAVTGRVTCASPGCRTTLVLRSRGADLLKAAIVVLDREQQQIKQITLRCPRCKAYTRVPAQNPTDASRQVLT